MAMNERSDVFACMDKLLELRAQFGEYAFERALYLLKRRHYLSSRPPMRRKLKADEKKQLYIAQDGKCARCGKARSIQAMTDDHFNVEAGEAYNDISNRRLVCRRCNSAKGARSLYEEAKAINKTLVQLLKEQQKIHDNISEANSSRA
jgi:5-methylcytosine-specific restriction endonuclease McrA